MSSFRLSFNQLTLLALAATACLLLAAAPQARADVANPQLSAGVNSTCAVVDSARVFCWGSNASRQLGLGSKVRVSTATVPYPVRGVKDGQTVGLSVGHRASCALQKSGQLSCWGHNASGALGGKSLGSTARVPQPAASLIGLWAAPSNAVNGGRHSCFRDTDATVKCLGANSYGQLGNGTEAASSTAVQVAGLTGASNSTKAEQVVAGTSHSCVLLANGKARCWGVNGLRQLGSAANTVSASSQPVDVPGISGRLSELATLGNHTCALRNNGGVYCWGADEFGQLGDGTVAPFKGVVGVSGLTGSARAVSAGLSHSCALVRAGAVQCWGSNVYGQLGDGTKVTSARPVSVIGLPRPATELAAGGEHTCARLDDASIWCWGRGTRGQLGDGAAKDRPSPVLIKTFGGLHFSAARLTTKRGRTDASVALVAVPPRRGTIRKQCRSTARVTLVFKGNGVTRTRSVRGRMRASGRTKCVLRAKFPRLLRALARDGWTADLRASVRGNSQLPGGTFRETYPKPS